ncbi:HNH endonuclease family protein [Streptomyces xiamenensis]
MRGRSRKHTVAVAVAAALSGTLALGGCTAEDFTDAADGDPAPSAPPADGAPPATDFIVTALPGLPTPEDARTQLGELTVAEQRPMTGYNRDKFPHWASQDGCTARQQTLLRDGEDVVTDDKCQPTSGSWYSAYDGETLNEAKDVDIDHMVPLANAWRSGADSWDTDRRAAFANDLTHPQLLGVSASSNRSKGDQGPEDWQPPLEDFWCEYGLAWTRVKHEYDLTVTQDEHDELNAMLNTCPA